MKNLYIVDKASGVYFVKLKSLEGLPFYSPICSYNILKARIFNLYYDEFLRYVRDKYHASLKGKTGYVVEFFREEKDAQNFCKAINERFNKILDYCHL